MYIILDFEEQHSDGVQWVKISCPTSQYYGFNIQSSTKQWRLTCHAHVAVGSVAALADEILAYRLHIRVSIPQRLAFSHAQKDLWSAAWYTNPPRMGVNKKMP